MKFCNNRLLFKLTCWHGDQDLCFGNMIARVKDGVMRCGDGVEDA